MRVSRLLFGFLTVAAAVPAFGQGVFRGPDAEVVGKINEYIRQGWKDNEVTPSPVAADEEWLRRVPDFSLAPNCKTHLRAGPVMAMESLNLVW